MSGLARGIRELVERRSLPRDRLDALMDLQRKKTDDTSIRARRLKSSLAPGILAAVAVLALLVPALTWLALPFRTTDDLRQRIADEVTANHIRLKPLEVETGDMRGIQSYFAQLDFLPVDSGLPAVSSRDLLGGRYCSIQGAPAAQLRLREPGTASVQTLYQARYDPRLTGPMPDLGAGQQPLGLFARGLRVNLWVEKGLLFALVRE